MLLEVTGDAVEVTGDAVDATSDLVVPDVGHVVF